jgi:ABC-2 type transport system ATP-binding protein/ribosome-dependent ATPase
MSALVDVQGVIKRFGSLTALDRVSLLVEPGEVVGLLGANGAGKSTLVKLILGLLGPDAGQVNLFGTPPSRAGRARVGYVPQGLGLYPDLTIAENLGFVAGAFAVEMPALEPDLEAARDRLVGSLSLGLRRRTAFVAAISHRPDLYLLDEPTSGVGPTGRADLWSTIAEVAERGAGVLVCTHYMEEAEQCHRVMVLANGAEVARGSTTEIIAGIEAVEVDSPDWAAALAALDAAGLRPGLVGKRLRMVGAKEDRVRAVLAAAGVAGGVRQTPAGFEEAFVALSAH